MSFQLSSSMSQVLSGAHEEMPALAPGVLPGPGRQWLLMDSQGKKEQQG